ncbi:MAG: DUF6438 domain-containing protein [Salibacteraceae bacterium]
MIQSIRLFITLILLIQFVACNSNKKASSAASNAKTQAELAKQSQDEDRAPDKLAVDEEAESDKLQDEYIEEPESPQVNHKPEMKEDTYFKLIRTPCFGQCPVYNVEIKRNGEALLQGKHFFDYEGFFTGRFTESQMDKILFLADQYGYFDMENVYDAPVTDLPSTTTALRGNNGVHWVYNRMNGPEELSKFEMEVETIIKEVQWKPASENADQ